MSHFYATIPLSARKTAPTARGHKAKGLETVAASWSGSVRVRLWHDTKTGMDCYEVTQEPWQGRGVSRALAAGVLGSDEAPEDGGGGWRGHPFKFPTKSDCAKVSSINCHAQRGAVRSSSSSVRAISVSYL